MNLKVEFRYAVLISLLGLLWLSFEFLIGLHDKYIQFQSWFALLSLSIPVIGCWLAIKEKIRLADNLISFKAAFRCGFFISVIAAILVVPAQLVFHKLIDPGFLARMIDYSTQKWILLGMDAAHAKARATMYFNLQSFIMQCFFETLFFGTIIALILAWRMRTAK